jgi:hypothetical protein
LVNYDKDIALQLNMELIRTHKGVEEESALKKELRNTKREMDLARENMRALSEEKRALSTRLKEAGATKLEETTRILSHNEEEIDSIRKAQVSVAERSCEAVRDHELSQAKSSNLSASKKMREELELKERGFQDNEMRLVARLNQAQTELCRVKRENDRISRSVSMEAPPLLREPQFTQESAEEEENARRHARLNASFQSKKLRQETDENRLEEEEYQKKKNI